MKTKMGLNRENLLRNLPHNVYEKPEEKKSSFTERMSMEKSLLALLEIDHEHEYELCKSVASHLLGEIQEPDEIDVMEDN